MKGVAYINRCCHYDKDGLNIKWLTYRSPNHNIYVGVPHKLFTTLSDPVMKKILKNVMIFIVKLSGPIKKVGNILKHV